MNDITHVKQVAAILYRSQTDFQQTIPQLNKLFSRLDYQGTFFPFVETDYYEAEMGADLFRGIVSFEQLVHPGTLVAAKQATKQLEDSLRIDGGRRINIDIGYMDMFKVVLASFKGRSNKIYLAEGVWADPVLYYEGGQYRTFMWGFPDFKSGIYNQDFAHIRSLYKTQLRQELKTDGTGK